MHDSLMSDMGLIEFYLGHEENWKKYINGGSWSII